MTCTRNPECDTANCTITALFYSGHTISMKLLSCRQPRPGVRLIARNPRGQLLLDRVIDESQNNIELTPNTQLSVTLDQLTDSIGLAVSCLTFSTPVQQGLQYILRGVARICERGFPARIAHAHNFRTCAQASREFLVSVCKGVER